MPGVTDVNNKSKGSDDDDSDDDEQGPSIDANERRKRFLTMANLKRVFRTLDLADDGYIDVDELYEAQRKMGGKLSKDEVRDVIWEVDDNMSGRLSMSEFLTVYRRAHADESGFEPKRFWSIVEFLLMDRDSSGEISLDEAMTTIFERQGADDLAKYTRNFFRAAGVGDDEVEPPPGSTVTFMGYYSKVGCAKPTVPHKTDLRRSWSNKLRVHEGRQLPPALPKSASASVLLPTLVAAERAAKVAAAKPPSLLQQQLARTASAKGSSPKRRPATSPAPGAASPGGNSSQALASTVNLFQRGPTGKDVLSSVRGEGGPSGGGLLPLMPLTEGTTGLASSALTYVGKSSAGYADTIKAKVSNVLHVAPGNESTGLQAQMA